MKKIYVVLILITLSYSTKLWAQRFDLHCTFSSPSVDQSIFTSGSNAALDQLNAQFAAYSAALAADYGRQVVKFDRKLAICSQVMAKMKTSYPNISKYPRTKKLYNVAAIEYKKLEDLSKRAAEAAKKEENLSLYKDQQDLIIDKATSYYHKAEDLNELGQNSSEIIKKQAQDFVVNANLTKEEKLSLNEEVEKIKFAEQQIKKLNLQTDPLKKEARDLERKAYFQTIAQGVVTVTKVVGKTLEMIDKSKIIGKATTLSQTTVEKYIEARYEKGHSPEAALKDAFEAAYFKTLRDEYLGKGAIKQLSKVPLLANNLADEIDKWRKIEENQRTTLRQIDNIIAFAQDGVERNEIIVERSSAKAKQIIDKGIIRYLSKSIP